LYGRVKLIHERDSLQSLVAALAAHYEEGAEAPWRISSALPAEQLLRAIVGFELAVEDIQIKFKLNQNHAPANVNGTIAALRAQGKEGAQAVATLMQQALHRRRHS
jgi:transcriptional regulator